MFKSVDEGANWTAVNSGLTDLHILSVVIDPSTPTTLYVVATDGDEINPDGGVFKSTDGGMSWAAVNAGLDDDIGDCSQLVSTLAISPSTPTTLYAGSSYCGVFRSMDAGASWTRTENTDSETGLNIFGSTIHVVAVDPLVSTTVYAGTDRGVFKTTDGGGSWTLMSAGLLPRHASIHALSIDPISSTVYAGTGRGVFRSMDGGRRWDSVNAGRFDAQIFALAIATDSSTTLYAGSAGGGVADFQVVGEQLPGIIAFMETPEVDPIVSGISVIRGWAFATHPNSQIESVRVQIGDFVLLVPCCSERADVQVEFAEFPPANTLSSGWGITFNWNIIPAPLSATRRVFVEIRGTDGELYFSEVRTVTAVRPGGFEFVDVFRLNLASVSIENNEIVLSGVVVRDKSTRQRSRINVRFRRFESLQSLGLVYAATIAGPSPASSLSSELPAWMGGLSTTAEAQTVPDTKRTVFEGPEAGQPVAGIGVIRGWAFAQGTPQPDVHLFVDEMSLGAIPCCSQRRDVANVFPDLPAALNSGWGMLFNYGLLGSGLHTIGIETEFPSDGASLHILQQHTVEVIKPGGFEFLDQFDLSNATAELEGEDIRLVGVQVRDKVSQQIKMVNLRLRWFESAQALGIVTSE